MKQDMNLFMTYRDPYRYVILILVIVFYKTKRHCITIFSRHSRGGCVVIFVTLKSEPDVLSTPTPE